MADDETVERKDATERRVYNLPSALVLKLRAFQAAQNIPSETEAARRLIEYALQARETVFDILLNVETLITGDSDFRYIGSELMKHSLVKSVMLIDGKLIFTMNGGDSGRLSPARQGGCDMHYTHDEWERDNWASFAQWKTANLPKAARRNSSGYGGGWEPAGTDLDDEIPF